MQKSFFDLVVEFKVDYHKKFIKNWLKVESRKFDQSWQIREINVFFNLTE